MRKQLFISYRRDGGLDAASYIYDLLKDEYEIFFDNQSLRNGRFDLSIEKSILECTDFLLIMSDNIFSRFEEEGDWISFELKTALRSEKNIVPVFLPGFVIEPTQNTCIQTVLRYNGIYFAKDTSFYTQLMRFLKSQKKCTLELDFEDTSYKLSANAIERLKEVYRTTREKEEYDVCVVLDFPDIDSVCEKMLPADVTGTERINRLSITKQNLLRICKNVRGTVVRAIEFMIADISSTIIPGVRYAARQEPLCNEYYVDADGICHLYEDVCVWISVINVLLEEFTHGLGRTTRYMNDGRYVAIDCIIDRPSKTETGTWSFVSFAPKSECNEPYWYYLHKHPWVISLKPDIILSTILPDFYYNVGYELNAGGNEKLKALFEDPDCGIRHLAYYWYGLH